MPSRRLPLLAILCFPACAGDDPTAETGTSSAASTGPSATTDGTGGPTTPTGEDTGTPSDTGTPATTGETGEPATTGEPAALGCDGATLLPVPEDTSLRGPWPVGARTAAVGELTVEVWYPAEPGSEAGVDKVRFDIRTSLPDADQGKVPDADNAWQDCDCHRDLPIDGDHGPYPVVLFVHGTAGFRSQSLEFMTHWASRGFVVVAADHPGLWLKDLLGSLCGVQAPPQDLEGDLAAVLAAVRASAGDLAFLDGRVDGTRVAMSGHSAGGFAVTSGGGEARVVMPMAGAGVMPGAALESVLILGAQQDQVVDYPQQQAGYADSPAPKRLVGIAGTGHLAFSSLCSLRNAEGQDFLELAAEYMICGSQFAGALFDCSPDYIADEVAWSIVRYTTSAALEETLHCSSAGDNFATLMRTYPDVGEFLAE